jgi:hypothetical protein
VLSEKREVAAVAGAFTVQTVSGLSLVFRPAALSSAINLCFPFCSSMIYTFVPFCWRSMYDTAELRRSFKSGAVSCLPGMLKRSGDQASNRQAIQMLHAYTNYATTAYPSCRLDTARLARQSLSEWQAQTYCITSSSENWNCSLHNSQVTCIKATQRQVQVSICYCTASCCRFHSRCTCCAHVCTG